MNIGGEVRLHVVGKLQASDRVYLQFPGTTGTTRCCVASLPDEVLQFVDRRDACDHFRGEPIDPPDAGRLREMRSMLANYCTGTDAQLAELRARYKANPAVLARLLEYETVIEQKRK